ncbi:hypothetical protein GE278_23280 (plasmid) [Enterobacteriaceae bacterium Kacie_13]|nr:hypothetical protein GE278_23280 [Enterobacteriaceae bacterium Kacie_13]
MSEEKQRDKDIRRWKEMHAEEELYQQACWPKAELDSCADELTPEKQTSLSVLYGHVLQWEINFHSAAYAT